MHYAMECSISFQQEINLLASGMKPKNKPLTTFPANISPVSLHAFSK